MRQLKVPSSSRSNNNEEEQMKRSLCIAAIAVATTLTGCGGGGSGDRPNSDIALPGIAATTNFSFDLGTVANGKYYVTDRNNKAVDVIDLNTHVVTQIKGTGANAFTGCKPTADCNGANNGLSGPDGIDAIPGTSYIFVGDVDNVRVIDTTNNTVFKSIQTGTTGFRADEGCYDPDDQIYMISSPDADTPFASFISPATLSVIATVKWTEPGTTTATGGNEQCRYDSASRSFIVNNDATAANPHGEVDVIPASSITALAPGTTTAIFSLPGVKRFPLGNCDPTGLALGPGTDMAVECRQGNKGSALTMLIMNRHDGTVLATLPAGGGDQTVYDARTNSYYSAGSRWHASGINELGGACSATNLCAPTLFVVDAATRTISHSIRIGNNAHSVAVDPVSGQIFMPYSGPTAPSGCADCDANGFRNGGVLIFTL
jgi:DNA-binding beta-propeller fold protein YncE